MLPAYLSQFTIPYLSFPWWSNGRRRGEKDSYILHAPCPTELGSGIAKKLGLMAYAIYAIFR
jgi:hypothetical protein